ncbi:MULTISPECIES: diiron oxygenase [Vibrio]|uniref:Aminobenzoate oxygenase n=1 Tax=Vibrio tasmaniensis TaxID=212663 RepID=A0A2N7NF66_9VIBR|nr:diiron oxygenase [Vibrio tasmaniensis]PMP11784.1 aminobenzoate oxygenase [Vibrio tasmaniensis]TKG27542.1 diiron oxygenase [Vibrio tasmaniensis]TKG35644.1 diiron oxygenase [Vibrio tasmaniensis]TKG44378.1 diiron oxygenase [Vibrio tasmaniensis]TKG46496.1 diiron oxygenase [Vibrio tasmaniensis]
MAYQSHANSWEQRATIRTRPRRIIEDDELSFYPKERQPLCFDPVIEKLGLEVQNTILLQSLYKYINDIVIFETEIVNKTALDIAKGRFPFEFSFEARYDAMSVVIDEDYHAFVAMDFQNKMEQQTGSKPFQVFNEIELSRAIPKAIASLDDANHKAGVELIAVAISENTVTSDVAAFASDDSVKRSIKGLMADHLADEGRHSKFWTELVKIYWAEIDESSRLAIGSALPKFLEEYLTNDIQKEFDTALINQLSLPGVVKAKVLENLVGGYPITGQHPMVANIRRFLIASGIFEHAPTRNLLAQYS